MKSSAAAAAAAIVALTTLSSGSGGGRLAGVEAYTSQGQAFFGCSTAPAPSASHTTALRRRSRNVVTTRQHMLEEQVAAARSTATAGSIVMDRTRLSFSPSTSGSGSGSRSRSRSGSGSGSGSTKRLIEGGGSGSRSDSSNRSSNYPLDRDEEAAIGRKIQAARRIYDIGDDLREQLLRQPTLEEWSRAAGLDERDLERALSQSVEAKNRLVTSNLGLVRYFVNRYARSNGSTQSFAGARAQDLTQEATLGLILAAEKFDPSKNCRFATYAQWWILKSLGEGAKVHDRLIKVPSGVADLLSRMKRTREELTLAAGRRPSDEELADALGIDTVKLSSLFVMEPRILSLDNEKLFQLQTGDGHWDVADASARISLQEMLHADLEFVLTTFLNEEEASLIRMRYGLYDGVHRSTREASLVMGLSLETGKAVYQKAIGKLRSSHMMRETLEPYLGDV